MNIYDTMVFFSDTNVRDTTITSQAVPQAREEGGLTSQLISRYVVVTRLLYFTYRRGIEDIPLGRLSVLGFVLLLELPKV